MKRKTVTIHPVVAVFFILILAWVLLSPLVLGWYLRTKIESSVNSNEFSMFTIPSYRFGWFSSEFDARLKAEKGTAVMISNKVIHGPMYLGIPKSHDHFFIGGFVLSKVFVSDSAGNNIHVLSVKSIIDLDFQISGGILGGITNGEKYSDFEFYNVSSGKGEYRFNQQNLTFDYRIPRFTVSAQQKHISVEALFVNMDMEYSKGHGLIGRADIKLGEINFSEVSRDPLDIKGLGLYFSAAKNNEFMNYRWRTDFNKVKFSDEIYSNGEVDFVLRNADTYVREQLSMFLKARSTAAAINSSQSYFSNIISLLPELFKNVEIELSKLYVETSKGFIDAWFRISAPGLSEEVMLDPIFLLSAIDVEGELSVAESMVRGIYESQAMNMFLRSNDADQDDAGEFELRARGQAVALLESLRNQHYIDLEGEQYVSSINIKEGEVTINGQQFNPMLWVLPKNTQLQ